jgi:hypothetical protein
LQPLHEASSQFSPLVETFVFVAISPKPTPVTKYRPLCISKKQAMPLLVSEALVFVVISRRVRRGDQVSPAMHTQEASDAMFRVIGKAPTKQ